MLEDKWVANFSRRFTSTYAMVLGGLCLLIVLLQGLSLYRSLRRDTAIHLVNVAEGQVAQAQKAARLAAENRVEESQRVLSEWQRTQEGLRTRDPLQGLGDGGNSAEIQANLEQMAPMVRRVVKDGPSERALAEYLPLMEKTASLYERDALLQGYDFGYFQVALMGMSMVIVGLAGYSVFRPLGRRINEKLEELSDSERRFHAFMDTSPVVAYMKDQEGRYVYVNQSFRRVFKNYEGELIGSRDRDLLPDEIAKKLQETDRHVLADNRSAELMEQIPGEGGRLRHWLAVKFPFVSKSGQRFLGGTSIDITERVLAEESMRESEKRWQLALSGTNDGLWDWNLATNEVYYSARWKQMLGYAEQEIQNTREEWESRVHPEDLARVQGDLQAHLSRATTYYSSEYRMRCRDGNYRWVLGRGQAVWDENGRALRMAGSHTDITDRKQTEEQLTKEAAYDPLTQLANRRRLMEQLSVAFRMAKANGRPLSLCLCDVDEFKQVNDDCGHAVGDRVLSTFAQILREALRSGDIAGRLGGDEFCVLLQGTREAEAATTMERVRSRLETMLFAQRDGKPFHVTATFGVAELNSALENEGELIEAADQALYAGKRGGRNRVNILRRDERPKAARFSS